MVNSREWPGAAVPNVADEPAAAEAGVPVHGREWLRAIRGRAENLANGIGSAPLARAGHVHVFPAEPARAPLTIAMNAVAWQAQYAAWQQRDLRALPLVYLGADGIM